MNTETKPSRAPSVSIWTALIAVYIVWGSTYLAIRFAVETLPPFLMAGFRFVLAGVVLYAIRRARGDAAPTRRQWRSATIIGLFLLLGGNGGVVWAEQHVASGIASLFIATVPLWMILIDTLRPGSSKPGWKASLGVLAGFAGIVFLIGPDQILGGTGNIDPIGAVVLILAALLWSIGSLYSRNADLPPSPLLATAIEMIGGGVGLMIFGTLAGDWGQLNLAGASVQSWLGLAYLIVFGSMVGFTAYTWLLRAAPTTLVSTYAYVNPIVALALGYMLAGETLELRDLMAAIIILGSVVLIKSVQAAPSGPAPAPASLAPVGEK